MNSRAPCRPSRTPGTSWSREAESRCRTCRTWRSPEEEEEDKIERAGLCVACHKYYNSPRRDSIRRNLARRHGLPEGSALTPEQHDLVREEALKGLAR